MNRPTERKKIESELVKFACLCLLYLYTFQPNVTTDQKYPVNFFFGVIVCTDSCAGTCIIQVEASQGTSTSLSPINPTEIFWNSGHPSKIEDLLHHRRNTCQTLKKKYRRLNLRVLSVKLVHLYGPIEAKCEDQTLS